MPEGGPGAASRRFSSGRRAGLERASRSVRRGSESRGRRPEEWPPDGRLDSKSRMSQTAKKCGVWAPFREPWGGAP
jgi:hypothetical protein